MRQTPPGGIMAVVANPLEKNRVGKEEELSCRSFFFLGGEGGEKIFFARIVPYTADPPPRLQSATVVNIEQGLRRTWERLPGVRQLEGLESAYFFVDRQRGKAIFISLWESEEAMNNSEEVMRPLRAELSEAFAANRVDVEHYEVGDMLVVLHI